MKQWKEHVHQITDTYDLDKERINFSEKNKHMWLHTVTGQRHVSSYVFEDSKEDLRSNSVNLCQTAINLEVICFDN